MSSKPTTMRPKKRYGKRAELPWMISEGAGLAPTDSASGRGFQGHDGQAAGDVHAHLPLHGNGLEREGALGTADKHIGAGSHDERRVRPNPAIGPSQRAGRHPLPRRNDAPDKVTRCDVADRHTVLVE